MIAKVSEEVERGWEYDVEYREGIHFGSCGVSFSLAVGW